MSLRSQRRLRHVLLNMHYQVKDTAKDSLDAGGEKPNNQRFDWDKALGTAVKGIPLMSVFSAGAGFLIVWRYLLSISLSPSTSLDGLGPILLEAFLFGLVSLASFFLYAQLPYVVLEGTQPWKAALSTRPKRFIQAAGVWFLASASVQATTFLELRHDSRLGPVALVLAFAFGVLLPLTLLDGVGMLTIKRGTALQQGFGVYAACLLGVLLASLNYLVIAAVISSFDQRSADVPNDLRTWAPLLAYAILLPPFGFRCLTSSAEERRILQCLSALLAAVLILMPPFVSKAAVRLAGLGDYRPPAILAKAEARDNLLMHGFQEHVAGTSTPEPKGPSFEALPSGALVIKNVDVLWSLGLDCLLSGGEFRPGARWTCRFEHGEITDARPLIASP